MARTAIIFGVVLTGGCSAGGTTTTTGGTLGSTHDTSGIQVAGEKGAGKSDPYTEARLAYANPGGMWMPQQLVLPAHVEAFQKLGVKLDPKLVADPLAAPLGAAVWLGGCTASFVSPDGLVITNHHCVQGALLHNSNEKENLVEKGFLAKTRADERSAGPSARVYVAQSFTDVTQAVRDGLEKIADPIARTLEVEKRMKAQIAACERDRKGLRCDVKSYFRGGLYILVEHLELRDVRLVYVPVRGVGNYGGEIDNWAWPRHTGDFSLYRVYVGKDGAPASYAPDNVPYQPAHHLQVSSKGVRPGDFVMVTGYPGMTSRTDTALEIHHDVEWYYPYQIAYLKERYEIAKAHLGDGGATAIKATTTKQGIQNNLEKTEGVLRGLTTGDLMPRKDALDHKIKEWAAGPGREAYKDAIETLERIVTDATRTARADFDRKEAFTASRMMATALMLTRWAEERAKPNEDRKLGFQDRDLRRALNGQQAFAKQYDRTLDRAMFRLALVRAAQLPEGERAWLAVLLGTKKGQAIDEPLIDKTLDAWYAGQLIEDEKLRVELLQKATPAQLKASKDPFVQAAQRIWAIHKAEEKKVDARAGELALVTPYYADAMREVLGGLLAPDANATLRITYGTVKSFKPASKEAADAPFTTAAQILAKDTGKAPFDAPKALLEAVKAKKYGPYADPALGGELPVDFLSDLDITGGNSGSPTLNDRGELVGLAFDGTLDGVASDVVFNGPTTRTIHLDIRYMLWNMDLLDGADHLITEMGLTPQL